MEFAFVMVVEFNKYSLLNFITINLHCKIILFISNSKYLIYYVMFFTLQKRDFLLQIIISKAYLILTFYIEYIYFHFIEIG